MNLLTIERYETGWDKAWEKCDGALRVQAHAPSILILKAASNCSVSIRAGVKEGGRDSATIFCNRREVRYGQRVEVHLKAGETVQLEARIKGSKDQCWNYWEIEDAAITLPVNMAVSFWSGAHLGDSLGMLIASENFARANGITLRVKSTPLFEEIETLFAFEHIRLVEGWEPMIHVHPFGYNFEELGWMKGIARALQLSLGGVLPEEVKMPRLHLEVLPKKEDVVLVQFDGRSGGVWSAATLRRFLAAYSDSKMAVIGGPDTRAYLGETFEYRKGNLPFIIRELLACKKFVGTDSGMAHLACVLGLKIDLLFSPAVSERLVRGIFSSYPQTPTYRTIAETRKQRSCDRRLLLVSTTNGWNLGDDLIRDGVLKLLRVGDSDPVVWINRCQVSVEDKDRSCFWSPIWKRLRNFGDPRSLVENAKALIVAGTPEWIDTIQPFYRLAAKTGLPIWIVGVGGGQEGQHGHLKAAHAAGVIRVATVRDEAARRALESCGVTVRRFLDPAFHSDSYQPAEANLFIFNPRLQCSEHKRFYKDLYTQLRERIDVVVVHEPEEYSRACDLFDAPVFFNSDYRKYIALYRSCLTYVGGRMHGAIPSLASGALVHLVCHEKKHKECSWLKEKLDHPESINLWSPEEVGRLHPDKMKHRFDNKRSISADFEDHRSFLGLHLKRA
jgi:hypothetical protein